MPKLKTHKFISKRVKMTTPKNGKSQYLAKLSGQNHFNAKESGKTTRKKRLLKPISEIRRRALQELIPYKY